MSLQSATRVAIIDGARTPFAKSGTARSMSTPPATPTYLRAEFRSRLFRFVDDVELLVDPEAARIEIRSASRVGHSDLGVNRKRVEVIRAAFE